MSLPLDNCWAIEPAAFEKLRLHFEAALPIYNVKGVEIMTNESMPVMASDNTDGT